MELERHLYTFTITDTKKIIDLGYAIRTSDPVPLAAFMNKEFINFNLVSLLNELELSLTPTTNLKITRQICYSINPPTLEISFGNEYATDDEALIFDRKFWKSHAVINVDHNMCVLPLNFQGKGVLKKVFQNSLQQYINMDAKIIHIYAGLNGGGYVWARHGFVANNKAEVETILNDAKMRLSATDFKPVEHIFNTYYAKSPNGISFPMRLWAMLDTMKPILMGAHWQGHVNLDNSTQLRNFNSYVFRE